jgi:outer membrane protein assembly factor BamA
MKVVVALLLWLSLLPAAALGQAAPQPEQPAPEQAGREQLIVDELTCRGNEVTSCDFILGHVYLAPGDPLDEEELGNARLRLASLPSFHSVDIYLEKGSARGRVRVVVEVAEADRYAREWLAGSSYRYDSFSQLLTGRLTQQNLFGTGKLLDLAVVTLVPVDGRVRSQYSARVQYVDPHWLGSKRTFLIAGMSGGRGDFENADALRIREENLGFDVTIGRRIFDFSYVSLFYRYNPLIDFEARLIGTDQRTGGSFHNHALVANFGWNSEDDPYFPTRGSRASLHWIWSTTLVGDMVTEGGFRKTWTTSGGTSWSVQISDTPGTEYRGRVDEHFEWSGGFARPIARSADGEVRRGRWYVEAGYSPQGHTELNERRREFGLKVGVRLDTRSFGMVDLYVIGSGVDTGRSRQ